MTEQLSPNFTRGEFACRCNCGFAAVSPELVAGLQALRDQLQKPVIILSACRCAAHNAAEGGARASQHVQGRAADIRVPGLSAREVYAAAATIPQFHGIGVDDERNFVHVDVREKPARWCYRAGREAAWQESA